MADLLYLSYWVRGYTPANLLRHYDRLLRAFPTSRLTTKEPILRIHAVSLREPLLSEQAFPLETPLADVIAACREYVGADVAFQWDTWWDLWQYEQEWAVQPARCSLWCFGPQFEADRGENLRVDFGVDALFLPTPHLPESAKLTQSNVRSLLKLVHDLDDTLVAERRQLWTETGENFAERLTEALQERG